MGELQLEVLSQREAEAREFTDTEAVISICDPHTPKFQVPPEADIRGAAAVLRLRLDDAMPLPPEDEHLRVKAWGRPGKYLTDVEARAIVAFAGENHAAGRSIIVHCGAGISRSAGVACALDMIFNQQDRISGGAQYHPNIHVKVKVLRAAR